MLTSLGRGKSALLAVGIVALVAILATQTYVLAGVGQHQQGSTGDPTQTNANTITVSGVGEVEVQPDRAIVNIGVVSQDSTAAGAVQQNANKMSSVIAAVEAAGVSNSSIQTTYYSIYPQESCCSGAPTITGYQVSNQVQVTIIVAGGSLAQLGAKVGQVIDAAAAQGANQVSGIQFTVSKTALQQAQQTALQMAVRNASKDAQILASAAGVSITGVVSISTNPTYPQGGYYYGPVMAAVASTPVVPPQSLTVTSTVQVVYSIG